MENLELERLLNIPDLSRDESAHAVSLVKNEILAGLRRLGYPQAQILDGPRAVDAADNYALLGYRPEEATLGETHTRWIGPGKLLRTQTTALIPLWLRTLASEKLPPEPCMAAAAGITYRRDERDKTHTGTPHQMDLWIIGPAELYSPQSLRRLVYDVVASACPSLAPESLRLSPSQHHYTDCGLECSAAPAWGGPEIEILECGLAGRSLLRRMGLPDAAGGLALGMGLDRLAMLRKGITDIRLLRDPEPRIASQMLDLQPYREISRQPAVCRDISAACRPGMQNADCAEIAERALLKIGKSRWLESACIAGRWSRDELCRSALERLALLPGEENVLVRVALRDPAGSIPKPQAAECIEAIRAELEAARRA